MPSANSLPWTWDITKILSSSLGFWFFFLKVQLNGTSELVPNNGYNLHIQIKEPLWRSEIKRCGKFSEWQQLQKTEVLFAFFSLVIDPLLTYVEHPAVPSVPASESLGLSSASLDSFYSIAVLRFSLLIQWLSELMEKKETQKAVTLQAKHYEWW